jgi:hypothetical protein
MVDPNKLVSDAAAEVQQAEAWAALNLGQRWWWAIALGAFVLGVIVKAVV